LAARPYFAIHWIHSGAGIIVTHFKGTKTADQATPMDACGLTQLVASGPDVRKDSLRNAILTEVFRAKRRNWVATPYFVPDEMLLEAFFIAVRRNVDVSIIIPKKPNHRLADMVREGYLTRLQESGADVWLYEPHMLHAKAILVDDKLAMVGSGQHGHAKSVAEL